MPADDAISVRQHATDGGHCRCWWRTMPPGMFSSEDRRALQDILAGTATIGERDWRYARCDCAASIIGSALRMKIPDEISYPVDARMTLLVRAALNGSAGAARVLAHMPWQMPLEQKLKSISARDFLAHSQSAACLSRSSTAAQLFYGVEDPS